MTEHRAIRFQRFAPSFPSAADVVYLPLRPPEPGEIRVRNAGDGVNDIVDEQAFEGLPHVYGAVEHPLSGRSAGRVIVNIAACAQT